MVAFMQDIDLQLRQPRVREHADLADDVFPGAWGAEALEFVVEGAAHGLDAAAHGD